MATFVVWLSGDDIQTQVANLEKQYPEPEHYKIRDGLYLVRGDELAEGVAENVGIGPSASADPADATLHTGAVIKLNAAHAGWERRTLWEWLQLALS